MAELSDIMIVSKQDLLDAFRIEASNLKEEWLKESRQQSENLDTMVTAEEVCQMTGYNRRTLTTKIEKGVLIVRSRQNRLLLFNKQEVIDAIKAGKLKKR